jgi:hypothetical protein
MNNRMDGLVDGLMKGWDAAEWMNECFADIIERLKDR